MHSHANRLAASSWCGVFYVTGGGISFLADILTTPGASKTLLDASIPYSTSALEDLLHVSVDQAVATETARSLGMAAYQRAKQLNSPQPFGFGVTATLTTDREKKGATRAHWAIQTQSDTWAFELELDTAESREAQEQTLNEACWQSINAVLLQSAPLPSSANHQQADANWQQLLAHSPHTWCNKTHAGQLLLPGAFNPQHAGHRGMLETAETITGLPGAYELCVRNVDKPNLDYLTMAERVSAISDRPVWLTNLGSFVDKAEAFPKATFAVGIDTLQRVAEARFYRDSAAEMALAFRHMGELGIRFLVFGRRQGNRFVTCDDLTLPDALRRLCEPVSEDQYRSDLSSTALRKARKP